MTSSDGVAPPAAVVVLAAGEGTRMRSDTAKVLHEICGRSLLGHVLVTARTLDPEHLVVVVGHQREQVAAHVARIAPSARTAVQPEQLGTGHAVRSALEALPEFDGTIVVLNGDTPLLTGETLRALYRAHLGSGDAATVLTAEVPDPTGLGRIVRGNDGALTGIVEHRDATPDQRRITEISGSLCLKSVLTWVSTPARCPAGISSGVLPS